MHKRALLPALLLLAAAGLLPGCAGIPQPRSLPMPAVVDRSMDEILQSLEVQLRENRPAIEAALQPGISDQALQEAEAQLGHPVDREMRDLYRWHNGLAAGVELFPGY